VTPSTVTVTGPFVAVDGTWAVILVSLQELTVAVTPLNLTTLVPWLAPKPRPVSVVHAPSCAPGGARLEIVGLMTVKSMVAGLELEPTVTTTGPVPGGAAVGTSATICELVQLLTDVAAVLLKLTVLVP